MGLSSGGELMENADGIGFLKTIMWDGHASAEDEGLELPEYYTLLIPPWRAALEWLHLILHLLHLLTV
jgi:hypothetical protein